MKLIPVKYHNKNYPKNVSPMLDELAGNLDSKPISTQSPYSLHTEYSYMKRRLDSDLLIGLDELKLAHKNGIPQLWKNIEWGRQYATFIERLVGDNIAPEVIEIHPPFKDYCKDIEDFWKSYIAFYIIISAKYPNTKIIIENRCGTMYTGASFLFSTCNDMLKLCHFVSQGHKELGVIIDYPQLFSAEKIKMDNVRQDKILKFNDSLKPYVNVVESIHLWGKRRSKNTNRWSPHSGDLNTFFSNDEEKKHIFLESLKNTYCDEKERYFVPEVNTSEDDLKSIVNDLLSEGFIFTQKGFNDYLVSISWDSQKPQFIIYNKINNKIEKYNAVGKVNITTGKKKYCVGNKDVISHEYIGCPNIAEIEGKLSKCPVCDRNDELKYCVRCTGSGCFVNNPDVLSRCNCKHYVYLAFFPSDIVKVGVAHERRKYERLFEQGALYAYIIAACKSGKIARELEDKICMMGIKDRVRSTFKVHNVKYFDVNIADEIVNKIYKSILKQIVVSNSDEIQLISPPEKFVQMDTLSLLLRVSNGSQRQLTIWDLFETDFLEQNSIEQNSIKILDDMNGFHGQIVAFIGSIAILKKEHCHYVYDFKQLYGREICIRFI